MKCLAFKNLGFLFFSLFGTFFIFWFFQEFTLEIFQGYNFLVEANLGAIWKIEKKGDLIPQVSAKSVKVVLVRGKFSKVLYSKNSKELLPIASLTKLLTALVAKENLNLDQSFKIKKVLKEDNLYNLKPGLEFLGKDLMLLMLVSSNNTAAFTLAQSLGEKSFIKLMQKKALELGMENTLIYNPTGLDPDFPEEKYNLSTAEDLIKLLREILNHKDIFTILSTEETKIVSQKELLVFNLRNTNRLLGNNGVLAGKTGSTPLAKECLALIVKGPYEGSYFLIVILASDQRYKDAKIILDWLQTNFNFN